MIKNYIEYIKDTGKILGRRAISENDIFNYGTDTISLTCIGDEDVDLRNSYFDISSYEFKTLPTLPISYSTLTYETSSPYGISLSSVPLSSNVSVLYNDDLIEEDVNLDDDIITFTTDTVGIYNLEIDNEQYNNLSSTTFSITAI